RRAGIAAMGFLAGAYVVLALPWTAARLSSGLIRFQHIENAREAAEATAIVLLGGDSQQNRVVETLRLNEIVHPAWIVVSGLPERAEEMRDRLVAGGVSPDHLILETEARTTREQAVNVER